MPTLTDAMLDLLVQGILGYGMLVFVAALAVGLVVANGAMLFYYDRPARHRAPPRIVRAPRGWKHAT